jgi:hypothetical protein
LGAGVATRVVYSFVDAERTDPHTGRLAPAPADVTHALSVVADRQWGTHWQTAVAWRWATGRPVTPVVGAERDTEAAVWTPRYGAPGSERLPAFARLDLSASRLDRPAPSLQLVTFAGLTNALDRENVYAYRYSPDYATRAPVRSVFNRALYVGASLSRL